jgi:cytochrome P450
MPPPKYPPGPKGHILFGNLKDLSEDLLGFLTECARQYGDIASFRIGNRRVYLLSHPEYIESVLTTDNALFIKHSFFWQHVQAIFGKGLLTSEGEHWEHQRRLIQPAFHGERIASYAEAMVNVAKQMTEKWGDQEVRDIHQDMMQLTADIIHTTLLGSRGNLPVEEIGELMNSVTHEIAVRFRRPFYFPDWIPTPGNLRYGQAVRKLDAFINGIIDEANSTNSDEDNLVNMLLHAHDSEGKPLSRQQVRDELITLFLAGHETTALALSWTWYLLSQHPRVEAKLLEELHIVLGGQSPTFDILRRLEYCEMVIQEAMRLFPPAYTMGREPIQPYELGGYSIPAGSTFLISQWVLHRDPRFFPNPEAFEPERWTESFTKSLPPFAYFPFGGGRRLCIGKAFAMTEAILLLATIAQRFQLSLVPDHPIALLTSVTLRPKNGMKMVVRKRLQKTLP